MEWVRELFHWVEALADTPYATWALAAVSFAESSFFPVPPDALLIAFCVGEPDRAMWFAFVCSIASVLGGMAGCGIGLVGGREAPGLAHHRLCYPPGRRILVGRQEGTDRGGSLALRCPWRLLP